MIIIDVDNEGNIELDDAGIANSSPYIQFQIMALTPDEVDYMSTYTTTGNGQQIMQSPGKQRS